MSRALSRFGALGVFLGVAGWTMNPAGFAALLAALALGWWVRGARPITKDERVAP